MADPRVLVVEDHAVVRRGLCVLLGAEGFDCVGDVGTGREALERAADLRPDVVLLDLGLPDQDGLEVLRGLEERAPDSRVVILTMHAEEEYVLQALAAGADGYVLKVAEPEALLEAIRRALRGDLYIDPTVAARVARRAVARTEPDPLTPREEEVLALIARGLTNRQIAEELFISLNTVETHRRHILEKLGARSRAELVAHAMERGLLP
ncbi:MAG: response regulator transcription factor [Actinobacteria bacterium]|nr:response regulator transcription factor [Actinomycetota bacterium]